MLPLSRRGVLAASLAGIALSPARAAEAGQPLHARLEPLTRFVGAWRGTGEGTPGVSAVERSYEPALDGRFLLCRNRSSYAPQAKNPAGEVHDDLGLFSFDTARKRFLLRQFHSEGFVNIYVSATDPSWDGAIVFETEAIENIPSGWRARETYRFLSTDEFEEAFELSEPGKAFALYSRNRLKRV